ncbi:protein ALP1-like [Myzus persicae]|uniref:protein ALP1-like n=1 Tax=Myzus persicae TaxID=13164 RepID=UPI000B938812|nr:protein ALP1-like [Myzus persicae]
MCADDDLLIAAAAVIIIDQNDRKKARKSRKRRFWVRPSLKSGRAKYSVNDFMNDLILDEVDKLNLEYRCGTGFRNFFRMTSSDFETLLSLIGPRITKMDTTFRKAIPVNERLAVTLRFLATGDSYHSLMYMFKISKQVISAIVPEVCDALINALQDYIKMPENESEWKEKANEFNEKWNFPNCVGAFDGKHIALQAPINSGTEYFNYKGFFSIVLFAVVDANYNFTYANIGCQGRISDGGVINETKFKKSLEDNTMNLPSPCKLPGRNKSTPFVFVADDAFPLTCNIMKPYAGTQEKGSMKRIFNYRLSRARRVSENTFGIISSVFRILRKPILLEPKTAKKVVLAIVY